METRILQLEATIGSITSQLKDFGWEVARWFKAIKDNDVNAKKAIDENDKNTKQPITRQLNNMNGTISAAEQKQAIVNGSVETNLMGTKTAI